MITRRLQALLFAIALILPGHSASAQQDADELARQTQNPVASLITVPFEANWDMGIGAREATGTILNFQPVVPFELTPRWNMVLRTILPLSSQPDTGTGTQRISGLGDSVVTLFLSPSMSGKVIWGVGPVMLLPTASNTALGSEKFGFGPSVVLLTQPSPWTVGILANQIWSVDGAIDRTGVNQTLLQPFLHYNLGEGLSLGASAEANINWKDDGTSTIPLLFQASKITRLSSRPVRLAMAVGPMLAHAQGADWRFRMSITFLFPR
jgi:hypothetical protein